MLSSGAPAGGVTVTAVSDALQGERSTVTMADGRYWLTALPPGRYDVTFAKPGLQTLTKRAVVEIARVARADATLEPSEDEESITSTAITPTVADMTAITTHYSDLTLDRLPVPRTPYDFGFITTGLWRGGYAVVDDVYSFQTLGGPFDTFEQVTFTRAGMPVEFTDPAPLAIARTRSGGDEFSLSLRDTITSDAWVSDSPYTDRGVQHLTEVAAGGRIVPQRLWFFGSAWYGSEYAYDDRQGALAKLSYHAAAQHNLSALYYLAKADTEFQDDLRAEEATLRYTGTAGPRFTAEVVAEHSKLNDFAAGDGVLARATYVIGTPAGDHVLTAGGQLFETAGYEFNSVFFNDRWIVRRLTINAGLRHENDETSPRAGAVWDLLGNGRHAIVANYGDYRGGNAPENFTRETTLGYAIVIGNTGSARIDLLRRTLSRRDTNGIMADFNYSLFDRFQTGANYTWLQDPDPYDYARHNGNAWFTLEIPFEEDELALTVMERYLEFNGGHFLTDVGARYTMPVGSVVMTGAVDLTNAFDRKHSIRGREARLWLRLRL